MLKKLKKKNFGIVRTCNKITYPFEGRYFRGRMV